jgi:hypothetical protein
LGLALKTGQYSLILVVIAMMYSVPVYNQLELAYKVQYEGYWFGLVWFGFDFYTLLRPLGGMPERCMPTCSEAA